MTIETDANQLESDANQVLPSKFYHYLIQNTYNTFVARKEAEAGLREVRLAESGETGARKHAIS